LKFKHKKEGKVMTVNVFQTQEYRTLIEDHIIKTISYLFDKDQEFALACEVKYIRFNPELPAEMKETFEETVLFILRGYTFESAKLEEGLFSFEAGFGSENFGSTVMLPLLAIKQIFVGENPILFNLAHPEEEKKNLTDTFKSNSKNHSMKALLSNPENKKLLRKNR